MGISKSSGLGATGAAASSVAADDSKRRTAVGRHIEGDVNAVARELSANRAKTEVLERFMVILWMMRVIDNTNYLSLRVNDVERSTSKHNY